MADAQKGLIATKKKGDQEKAESACIALSELFFVVLPFLVLSMTLGQRGELRGIFLLPEWSIVSVVICGQTIVRFVGAALRKTILKERFLLFLSGMVIFLIVNVTILSMVLTTDKVSIVLAALQIIFFVCTSFLYFAATLIHSVVDKEASRD
jgi:hypothetical protein